MSERFFNRAGERINVADSDKIKNKKRKNRSPTSGSSEAAQAAPKEQAGSASDTGTLSVPPVVSVIVLAILCFLLYANSLDNGMVNWDDSIVTSAYAKDLSLGLIKDEFLTLRGSYQPLRNISHVVDHELFGEWLPGHRLHSIALYALNVVLVFWMLLALFRKYEFISQITDETDTRSSGPTIMTPENLAFIIATFFALHPIHVEAVVWLAARKETLYGVFYCLSFLLWIKMDTWKGKWAALGYLGSFAAYLFALLSKPAAVSLPLTMLAYDLILLRPSREQWKRRLFLHAPYWLPLAGTAIYFARLAGTTQTEWATLTFLQQLFTSFKALLKYAEILFYPVHLSARYYTSPGRSLMDGAVIAGGLLAAIIIGLFVLFLRKRRILSFAIIWFFLNWLPTAGLIPISTKVADRYMYIGLLGVILLVTAAVIRACALIFRKSALRRRLTAVVTITFFLLASAGLAVETIQRNRVWKDERTLWEDMAQTSPTDMAMNHLARFHLDRKEWALAEDYYRKSLQIDPTQIDAWNNLGNALLLQNKPAEAEKALKMVLELYGKVPRETPRSLLDGAYINLAMVSAVQGNYVQAEETLKQAVQRNANNYRAWDLLGELRLARNDYDGVLKAAEKMRKLKSEQAKAYVLMAYAYNKLGRPADAQKAYLKAYELQPEVAGKYFGGKPTK